MHHPAYTFDRRLHLNKDRKLTQDSQKPVGVSAYVYVMCMYKGGDWAQSQKAGWVHCVTAHVHSPPSIPASLCMFIFSSLRT